MSNILFSRNKKFLLLPCFLKAKTTLCSMSTSDMICKCNRACTAYIDWLKKCTLSKNFLNLYLPINSFQCSLGHSDGTSMNFGRTVVVNTSPFPHTKIWSSISPFHIKYQILNKRHLVFTPNDFQA